METGVNHKKIFELPATDLVRLEKGNTFGEMGLFRKAERSASAEAAEKTRLLVVNRDCLDPLKKRNPKIAAKLFLNLANRLQSSLKDTHQRLLKQKDFNLKSLEENLKMHFSEHFPLIHLVECLLNQPHPE